MGVDDDLWSDSIENILASIGEKANCMAKLCTLASKYYDKQRTYLLLPASIISWGLNIFGMVATYMGPDDISEPFVILIASIGNFVVATLTTVAEKSKAGDKVELFNQASKEFYLLYSNISAELSCKPSQRCFPTELLKSSRDRYNVLLQSNPNIPDSVIIRFWVKQKHFPDVNFPDHILELRRIPIYDEEEEKEKMNRKKFIKGIKGIEDIVKTKEDEKSDLKANIVELNIQDEELNDEELNDDELNDDELNDQGLKEVMEVSRP